MPLPTNRNPLPTDPTGIGSYIRFETFGLQNPTRGRSVAHCEVQKSDIVYHGCTHDGCTTPELRHRDGVGSRKSAETKGADSQKPHCVTVLSPNTDEATVVMPYSLSVILPVVFACVVPVLLHLF